MALSVEGSTLGIQALEPACNGVPLVGDQIPLPENRNMDPSEPKGHEWAIGLTRYISNTGKRLRRF